MPNETTPLVDVNPEISDIKDNEAKHNDQETPLGFVIDDMRLNVARNLLYGSHLFAKFTEMGWQFCVILFLTAISNYKSIVFVSANDFFCGLMNCLFGSTIEAFIDIRHHNRFFIAS